MDSKYIMAIHAGHNASALIGDENGVLYAIQEERIVGEKNFWGFPKHAILACLDRFNLQPADIHKFVLGTNQVFFRYHSREDVLKSYALQDNFLGKIRQRVLVPFVLATNLKYGQKDLLSELTQLGFKEDQVAFFDHHASHAATAYYGLRKDTESDYLVVTCDGMGDNLCASVRIMGPNGKDEVVATTHSDNSLGALYSWVTFRMGFVPLEHEYKLMGMAPYTKQKYANEVRDVLYQFLDLDESGLKFKRKGLKRINDASRDVFNKLDGKRFDSICGGLQTFTEEILSKWIKNAVEKTGIRKVLAGGGVFMNVKANKVIADLENVDYFEAFPSCGDESLAFGAYFLQAAEQFSPESVKPICHYYFGDDLDETETIQVLEKYGYNYRKSENMALEVAQILAKGKPLARCTGNMEFGARALGNRSIIADPSNQDVVRVINQMVKKRDFWMPFAPMMKKDKSHNYIHNDKNLDSPYMMMTFDTKDNFKDMIAAVHNADLTCRAQLLTEQQNPEMYAILDEFEKLTGRSVVLNTSYNLHGFPIARNAEDGLHIFKNSGLEYMQVGDFLVSKNGDL